MVNSYIHNGWADKILINPDCTAGESLAATIEIPITTNRQDLHHLLTLEFTNAQIVSYFMTRLVDDGLPACDFKSINKSAMSFFKCGHVQKI